MSRTTAFDYQACPNLPHMLFNRAEIYKNRNFLWRKTESGWHATTWAQTVDQVKKMAAALRALGLGPGDRVLLVSENRPEWLIADFAIMSAGLITVPGYTTNTAEDHAYLLENSGAKAAIISSSILAEKVFAGAAKVAYGNGKLTAILMDDPGNKGFPCHTWAEALDIGTKNPIDFDSLLRAIGRQDTACLIYTSGTGGNPKGVMLSHGALLHNARGAYDLLLTLGLQREVFLSFLPLSHAYEHSAGMIFPASIGAEIYYVESADKLSGYLTEVRPTIMTAVPRLYEMLYGKITASMKRAGKFQVWMFNKAVAYGKRRYLNPDSFSEFEKFIDKILDILVRRKARAKFGGRLKALVSGGAPLNYDIGLFFTALGLNILQGYGQTETAPIVSCNSPLNNDIATVGRPVTATEVKIASDGEILVRGELTMKGYWNNPDATAAAMQDGWVHTGDIGEIDAEGRIKITDRKKDIIVLSGGDTLSPQRIEGFLNVEPEIAQSAVFGDKQSYVVALIVPDKEFFKRLPTDQMRAALDAAVERVSKKLSITERVRRFAIISDGFTIENGMLTPSMKIRRHKIKQNYSNDITKLYG